MSAPSAQPPPVQPPGPAFDVGVQAGRDGCLVLTLSGDLDHASHLQLLDEAGALIAGGRPRLVVDLAGVNFCDSTGLGALVRVHRQAQARGGWLRLAAPGAALRRMLEVTNLVRLLAVYGSVPDAAADGPRGPVR